MKSVSMLEFRRNARRVLEAVRRGERLLLTYRGKPIARLEPVSAETLPVPDDDPLLRIEDFGVNGGAAFPTRISTASSMGRSAFVDSSGWYAIIDRPDPAHAQAASVVRNLITAGVRLLTTDYVIDECCTLALVRSGPTAATKLLDLGEKTAALDVEWIGTDRFESAKAIGMKEHGIKDALTTDSHFLVRGFRPLLQIGPARGGR